MIRKIDKRSVDRKVKLIKSEVLIIDDCDKVNSHVRVYSLEEIVQWFS